MGNYAVKGNGLRNPDIGSAGGIAPGEGGFGLGIPDINGGRAGGNMDDPSKGQRKKKPFQQPPQMSDPLNGPGPVDVAPPINQPPMQVPGAFQPRMRFGASLGEPMAYLGGSPTFREGGFGGPGAEVGLNDPMAMPNQQIPMNNRAPRSGWNRTVRPLAPLNSLAMNMGRR